MVQASPLFLNDFTQATDFLATTLDTEPRDSSGIFLKLKPEVKSEVVTKEEAKVEEEAEAMAEAYFKVKVKQEELFQTSTTVPMNGQSCS